MKRNILNNKKAISMQFIILIILGLSVTAILSAFYGNVFEEMHTSTDKQTCKTSVYSHFGTKMKNKLAGMDVFSAPIKCPTNLINIEKDVKEEETKDIIAEEIYDCWDKFGEGKLELFEGNNVYCSICSHIDFENKELVINNFGEYLATRLIPRIDTTQDVTLERPTYIEYLTAYKTKGYNFIKQREYGTIDDDSIDTSNNNEYSVLFVYVKGREKMKNFLYQSKQFGKGSLYMTTGNVLISQGVSVSKTIVGIPLGFVMIGSGSFITKRGVKEIKRGLVGIDYDWGAFVLLRPYSKQMIQELGCSYAPAEHT